MTIKSQRAVKYLERKKKIYYVFHKLVICIRRYSDEKNILAIQFAYLMLFKNYIIDTSIFHLI